jgi:dTDP-4-amino-4,6-dideoxygalactose transaminase
MASRETFIKETNADGVMTRPLWKLMHRLPMFENSKRGDLTLSEWLEARVVNIPSTPVNLR